MMNSATINTGYIAPVPTMKTYVVKAPLFLLRKSTDSELARMAQERDAQKKVEETQKAVMGSLQTDNLTLKGAKEKADREIAEGRVTIDLLKAEQGKLQTWAQELVDGTKKLEERLGRATKPTSFERLLEHGDDESQEKLGPSV